MAREVDRIAARNKFYELEFGFQECGYVRDVEFYSKLKVSPALNRTSGMLSHIMPSQHCGA